MNRASHMRTSKKECILVNQPPDPVMITHMMGERFNTKPAGTKVEIMHPGHGLSEVERQGLKHIYGSHAIQFTSFADSDQKADPEEDELHLTGEVIGISIGNATDIFDAGFGDDHAVELLRRILSPLFRRGASLLYGGALPDWNSTKPAWEQSVNFTEVFLELLLAERERDDGAENESAEQVEGMTQRLYNLSSWPYSRAFTIEQQAQWINTSTFIRIPNRKNETDEKHFQSLPESLQVDHDVKPTLSKRLMQRNSCYWLSVKRKAGTGRLQCDVPDRRDHTFEAMAALILGGKLEGYAGIIPGVWEEILYTMQARKPCFIIGALRGAAGQFGRMLLHLDATALRSPRPIPELTAQGLYPDPEEYSSKQSLSDDVKDLPGGVDIEQALSALWDCIRIKDDEPTPLCLHERLNNGLNFEENSRLMTSDDFGQISSLVITGLKRIQSDHPGDSATENDCICPWCLPPEND
ncbi:MAG: hypothetical protein AAF492_11990, partial [Verrucomicrobiota bacterium]